MNLNQLPKHFERIGAKIEINLVPKTNSRWQRSFTNYNIDVIEEKNNERFLLNVEKKIENDLFFAPLDVQKKQRHLLLFVNNPLTDNERLVKQKFLCGHDERHWFVAGIRAGATNVRTAMESLKPPAARASQMRTKVRKKNRNKRHNAGFIRQGEWFFIPRPELEVVRSFTTSIQKNEPLSRGWGSKPHIVDEIYRKGGESVQVCREYPNGLTYTAYRRLLKRQPSAKYLNWRSRQRNPTVYARGRVRHADHATITLNGWHEVVMNREFTTQTVAFLD